MAFYPLQQAARAGLGDKEKPMRTLWQDVRYAVRALVSSPGFVITVLIILVLGIGANTAIFSVINAVLLKPLPYKDSGRILVLRERKSKEGLAQMGTSHRNFLYWRERNRVFEYLAAVENRRFYLTGVDQPRQIRAVAASPCLFSLLGIQPRMGTGFLAEQEIPGNDHVVVLSDPFWREYWGAQADVIGKAMSLNGESYTVVGVMPPGFWFPFDHPAPFWVPLALETGGTKASTARGSGACARLRKGITLEQARAEMAVMARRLEEIDPKANAGYTATVSRLLDDVVKDNGRLLLLLQGAAGFVLLIACGNAAALFLARATIRQRGIAVRLALGASRVRVVRQILTESLLLSVVAGLLSIIVAFWTAKGLVRLCPAEIPRMGDTRVDVLVLMFTLSVSGLTGLVFGALPAWKASGIRLADTLKEGWLPSASGLRWRRFRACLVVSQIGVALTLVASAGLLIRSLLAVQQVDLGFRPSHVLTAHIELPRMKYPEGHHRRAFFAPLLERVRALAGVHSAALVAGGLDLGTGGAYMSVRLDTPRSPDNTHSARCIIVTPGFFATMGIRVLEGRTFTDQDIQAGKRVAVIDENMARSCFPDIEPLGRTVDGLTIIGVVSTLKDFETLAPTHDTLFMPLADAYPPTMDLVVKTEADPMRWAGALRSQVLALDKDQAISELHTVEMILARMLAPRRFSTVLLGLFAGVALVLAGVGLYGLLQYMMTQQARDIGIRMALGARANDVVKDALWQGLTLTATGAAIGLAGALALTRVISSFLYDTSPLDPLTFASASLLLVGVALLASYVPARRAARIDPMTALRCE
jgi:putative ABC transport system permease protein